MNRRSFLQATGSTLALQILVSHRACLNAQGASPARRLKRCSAGCVGWHHQASSHSRVCATAASTTGANRFQPPVKPAAWTGVRDAFEYGPRAWQPFRPMIPEIGDALTGSGPMDEDCLSLNLWTPSTGAGQRPVMVWFHGGGQRTGSGNSIFYDGAELARKHNVVAISVNHRLNALGYLWLAGLPGTGERFARTSNLPLLDLVAALEWVRETSRGSAAIRATSRSSGSRAAAEKPRCCRHFRRERAVPPRDHHEYAGRHRDLRARTGASGRSHGAVAATARSDAPDSGSARVDAGEADRRCADGAGCRTSPCATCPWWTARRCLRTRSNRPHPRSQPTFR
jgi:Carboxylesterase type B